jgi:hypothetical protein
MAPLRPQEGMQRRHCTPVRSLPLGVMVGMRDGQRRHYSRGSAVWLVWLLGADGRLAM